MNSTRITRILLYALLALFPLGQLTRLSLGSTATVYIHDIVIILILSSWFVSKRKRLYSVGKDPLLRPIIYFVGACLLSLIVNSTHLGLIELSLSSLYLWRFAAYGSLYFVVSDLVKSKHVKAETIQKCLIVAGIGVSVGGLIQYAYFPSLRSMTLFGWDPHEYRVFGTLLDSGYTGILLVLTLIVAIHRWRLPFISSPVSFIALSVTYVAMALTYSRSSYVAFIAGLGMYSTLKRSWIEITVAMVLLGITIPILPRPSPTSEGVKLERTSTVNARVVNYEESLGIIAGHPLFGIGFNTLRYYKRDNNLVPFNEWEQNHAAAGLDNSLLFVGATTGIIGFTAYLYLWIKIVQYTATQSARLATLPSIVAVLIHSLFLNTLFYPWVMIWMWILIGSSSVPSKKS